MRVSVIADKVSFSSRAPQQLRILLSLFPNDEERRLYVGRVKHVEEFWSAQQRRAIVEGQCNTAPALAFDTRAIVHQPLVSRMKQQIEREESSDGVQPEENCKSS